MLDSQYVLDVQVTDRYPTMHEIFRENFIEGKFTHFIRNANRHRKVMT